MSTQFYRDRPVIFLATATFGAHVNTLPQGFHLESVTFLALMFYDWVAPLIHRQGTEEITTALKPYLEQLQKEGFLKRNGRSNPPRYSLTGEGLLELVRQVMRRGFYERLDDFFFVHSYIENYSPRTLHMLESDPVRYPYQLKVQMEALLDLQEFTKEQLKFVANELRVIEERMNEQEEVYQKVLALKEHSNDEILDVINKENPYVLHSTRPLEMFLNENNSRRIIWELTEGGRRRNAQMWNYRKEQLLLHRQQLEQLLESTNERQRGDKRLLNLKELPELGPFKD